MTNQPAPAPATPPADDLLAKLAAKQAELDALKAQQPPPRSTAREVRRVAAEPPAPVPIRKTREQELEEFANAKSREVEVLRVAKEYGLTEEELEGDYATPVELRLAAQVKKMEKDIQQLGQTAADAKAAAESLAAAPPASENLADTGGPTGKAATREQKIQARHEQAGLAGRTHKGRLLKLMAIHKDPSKVVVRTPEELEE